MRIENGCFELMRWGELLMTQVRAGRRWETNKRPSGIIPCPDGKPDHGDHL